MTRVLTATSVRRSGGAHVEADRVAAGAGAELEQVAQLRCQPEPPTADRGDVRPHPAGERIVDAPRVADLADEARILLPDPQPRLAAAVEHAVRDDLADRDEQVEELRLGQPRREAVA